MILSIGACRIALPAVLEPQLPATFAAFRSSGTPDLTLSLHITAMLERCGGMPAFKADQAWNLWTDGPHRTLLYDAGTPDTPLARMQWHIDWPRHVDLFTTTDPATLLFEYPLVQLQVIEWLASRWGFVVHAGATVIDEQAIIFSGPPEVGKSTLARLCAAAGLPILCDDRVAVTTDDGISVSGTPWHSTTALVDPRWQSCAALLFLTHGPSNRLTPLTTPQALRRLAPEVLLPLWEQELVDRVLTTLATFIATIPCYEFAFVPDQSAVAMLRHVIR